MNRHMWTTRQRNIAMVTGGLALASLVPVLLSLWLAHHQASVWFYRQLEESARRVTGRVHRVTGQVRDTLDTLSRAPQQACTPARIQQLQQQVFTHDYIDDISSTAADPFPCSSRGPGPLALVLPSPDWQDAGGLRLWFAVRHTPDIHHPVVAMARGNYLAVVDPHTFVDLTPPRAFPVAVSLTDRRGHTTVAGTPRPRTGTEGWRSHPLPGLPLAVTASAPKAFLYRESRRLARWWLPAGLLGAALILWLLARYLKRAFSLQSCLAGAIEEGAFRVCYQPVVDLRSGACTGAEALLRWPQPDGTLISPEVFIPLAEETGLITRLTPRVVAQVLEELGPWLAEHPVCCVSVNLSPADLDNPDLPGHTAALLQRQGVAPGQLAFEVTERVAADPEQAAQALQRLRRAGHRILLDDFGTGYSSLSWLQSLPVDGLKLDKSFLQSGRDGTVVRHVTDMARALGLSVTAEGIEDRYQAWRLQALGVSRGQGWLYSRALSAGEFMAWAQVCGTGAGA